MAIVVSDTSPVRALHHLGQLDLLARLFGSVFIPPAVAEELAHPARGQFAVDVGRLDFVIVRAPVNCGRIDSFRRQRLDPGECEALALAEELNADWVLIDERAGRIAATKAGLTPLGLLGILLQSRNSGFIAAVAPLLDRLEKDLGFFISSELRQQILRTAGE